MRAKIEIEAKNALELAELLTKLAAHLLRSDDVKPIKILDGGTSRFVRQTTLTRTKREREVQTAS